jgi:hypothetical protein
LQIQPITPSVRHSGGHAIHREGELALIGRSLDGDCMPFTIAQDLGCGHSQWLVSYRAELDVQVAFKQLGRQEVLIAALGQQQKSAGFLPAANNISFSKQGFALT